MENAAKALKMAAAVLIFIIAIATSFSLFKIAKQTADSIISMRDKQKYLESPEVSGGILYTSSEDIKKEVSNGVSSVASLTTKGDRIVQADDVVSTIYRYNKEKYGVTIIDQAGEILTRFDSNTEYIMSNYYNIDSNEIKNYINILSNNIGELYNIQPKFEFTDKDNNTLVDIYSLKVTGNDNIECGAPWYGNDKEILRRISCELSGTDYIYNNQKHTPKQNLYNILQQSSKRSKIIEVLIEIDQGEYLKDEGNITDLLVRYQMPTVEIVYLVYDKISNANS